MQDLRDSLNTRPGEYRKVFTACNLNFTVALYLYADPHIELPRVKIIDLPDELKGKLLPHISNESYLCYVDEEESDWNPNNIGQLYAEVDRQILATLEKSVNEVSNTQQSNRELEGEFTNYWRPEAVLYVLSRLDRKSSYDVTRLTKNVSGEAIESYVCSLKSDKTKKAKRKEVPEQVELRQWLALRNDDSERSDKPNISTHYINVTPSRLTGVAWPLETFKDLLSWLSEVNQSAKAFLLQSMLKASGKRHIVIMDIQGQGLLGVYLELEQERLPSERLRRKTNLPKGAIGQFGQILSSNGVVLKFTRLQVEKNDRKTLFSRNSERANVGNLGEKRIALIGCGTIGGYLADLLFRSGAGCGSKPFELYDADSFSPHNFGRHILDGRNFRQNKAIALKHKLQGSVHLSTKIEAFPETFPLSENEIAKFDLVIDATGRVPVSKRLAFLANRIDKTKRPVLIHSFNDGNGRVSKVMIDSGNACYGCMLENRTTHTDEVDNRFKEIDVAMEKQISCGSTFIAHDASVSLTSASLALEAALQCLEEQFSWTYAEHAFRGVNTSKPRIVAKQPQCKICSNV